jgi:glycine/D-amino acid oxidase-like deaminating enzyme
MFSWSEVELRALQPHIFLKQAGVRVAVVDQKSIGSGETSRTTAHITFVTDARLHELASGWEQKQPKLSGEPAIWRCGRSKTSLVSSRLIAN